MNPTLIKPLQDELALLQDLPYPTEKQALRIAALTVEIKKLRSTRVSVDRQLVKRCRGPHHVEEQSRFQPPTEFYVKLENADGLSGWCKYCHRRYSQEHPSKRKKTNPVHAEARKLAAQLRKEAKERQARLLEPLKPPELTPGERRCKFCNRVYRELPPVVDGDVKTRLKRLPLAKYRKGYCEVCRALPQFQKGKKP